MEESLSRQTTPRADDLELYRKLTGHEWHPDANIRTLLARSLGLKGGGLLRQAIESEQKIYSLYSRDAEIQEVLFSIALLADGGAIIALGGAVLPVLTGAAAAPEIEIAPVAVKAVTGTLTAAKVGAAKVGIWIASFGAVTTTLAPRAPQVIERTQQAIVQMYEKCQAEINAYTQYQNKLWEAYRNATPELKVKLAEGIRAVEAKIQELQELMHKL